MPRNEMSKDELKVRVLKLKHKLYDKIRIARKVTNLPIDKANKDKILGWVKVLPRDGASSKPVRNKKGDVFYITYYKRIKNFDLSVFTDDGDIDFNAGAMIKTESGLGTAISANLMGVNISAKAGTIGITAPLSVGISSDTDVGIKGGQIRLNTPVGEEIAAKIKAVAFDGLKVTAIPLEGVDQEDQPSAPPEYDREGDAVLTSGGERPGKKQKINTCLLYTSPSPRDRQKSRMPSSA